MFYRVTYLFIGNPCHAEPNEGFLLFGPVKTAFKRSASRSKLTFYKIVSGSICTVSFGFLKPSETSQNALNISFNHLHSTRVP